MSLKLFLHTVFCIGLAGMLALHILERRRRVVYSILLAIVIAAGASPFLYRYIGAPWFPRVTLAWPHVLLVGTLVAVFTPRAGRSVRDSDFDRYDLEPTAPAPLEDRPTLH